MKILESIGQFIAVKLMLVYNVIKNHKVDFVNPHRVTKSQVGLGNVDNTSDADKPLSNKTKEAIGNLSGDLNDLESGFTAHKNNQDIHQSREDVSALVDDKVASHNVSGASHQDIRNSIQGVLDGNSVVGRSEYSEKLGDDDDFYTKTTLDQKINKHIKGVNYDPVTAVFTFTFEDGTVKEIDTPVENLVKDGHFDEESGELVLTLVSDNEIRISAENLVKAYSGKETTTTTTIVGTDGKIGVDVNQGAIEKVHLSEALLNEIQNHLKKTDDLKDNSVTFAEAEEVANVVSGEKVSVLFGKIMKWFGAWSGKLANLADNPNESYATKDEAESDFNTLFIDVTELETYLSIEDGSINEALANQINDFDFEKPCQAVIVDDNYKYTCDGVYVKETNSLFVIEIGIPHDLINSFNGNVMRIKFQKSTSSVTEVTISVNNNDDVLFLKENGDGMLNTTDGGNWGTLRNKLAAGEKLTLYINPRGKSDLYYPASYNSVNNDDGIVLNIEISYPVTTDDKTELWVEKWDFANFVGLSSQYEHKIEKLPFGGSSSGGSSSGGGVYIFKIEYSYSANDFIISDSEQAKYREYIEKIENGESIPAFINAKGGIYPAEFTRSVSGQYDQFLHRRLETLGHIGIDSYNKEFIRESYYIELYTNDFLEPDDSENNTVLCGKNYISEKIILDTGGTIDRGNLNIKNYSKIHFEYELEDYSDEDTRYYDDADIVLNYYEHKFRIQSEIADLVLHTIESDIHLYPGIGHKAYYNDNEIATKADIPGVNVVSEYPTDLTDYPDGSIFIKTE